MRRTCLLAAIFLFVGLGTSALAADPPKSADKLNILWILGDDVGPDLGCYGEPAVRTPNLDKLASQGVRFTHAFTTGPVCSTSRSALMTGMWQTSIGAYNHRRFDQWGSKADYRLPADVKTITDHFRQAGYYTANVKTPAPGLTCGGKTDFNFRVDKPFDGTDWAQRPKGKPFFAEINFLEPHRGRVWPEARKQKELVDPAKVRLPPYYPDHPVVRNDYANYLDAVNLLDVKVGAVLKRLEEEGLADSTIIIFFGDNGRCHVRDKQWLYDGGLHVPLIVRIPEKYRPKDWKPGSVRDDLVSGIDFAATSLKLAGIDLPKNMHGQNFIGPDAAPPRKFIIGARDRCDETVDRIRSVRTHEYNYIRNFMPERPYTQANEYKEKMYPALKVMKELHAAGKLTPDQQHFMAAKKPAEELYDMKADPHELHNLADSPKHKEVLKEMRDILDKWMKETGDQGGTPEKEPARKK